MDLNNAVAIVTGGASGLGLASARRLTPGGARVLIVDLERSNSVAVVAELGHGTRFAAADVADEAAMDAAVAQAEAMGSVCILVHCAGKGGSKRVVEKDGSPMPLVHFADIVTVKLVGTFNALRLAAAWRRPSRWWASAASAS
jgi:NAD(P)-dependent dehydrogenase (short-subunit alcohol dehydrogenase family)